MEWEYKVIKTQDISKLTESTILQEELNNYGKQGWELVGFAFPPQVGNGWMPKLETESAIFKRLVQ